MLSAALLLLALVGQPPVQQPTQTPAAKSQTDTTRAKQHRARRAHKAKAARAPVAPRDTTKKP